MDLRLPVISTVVDFYEAGVWGAIGCIILYVCIRFKASRIWKPN